MKLNVLTVIIAATIICSCNKVVEKDPCDGTKYLPPIPQSPTFILIDKNTGKEMYPGIMSLDKYITAKQPCNSNTLTITNEFIKNPGDSIYYNYFSFNHVRFNVGYDAGACHTIYMTLNGTDTDTLEFTGNLTAIQEPCYTRYDFNIEKLKYNGTEVAPTIVAGTAAYPKYYILRK